VIPERLQDNDCNDIQYTIADQKKGLKYAMKEISHAASFVAIILQK
jgi:hypothetical protein